MHSARDVVILLACFMYCWNTHQHQTDDDVPRSLRSKSYSSNKCRCGIATPIRIVSMMVKCKKALIFVGIVNRVLSTSFGGWSVPSRGQPSWITCRRGVRRCGNGHQSQATSPPYHVQPNERASTPMNEHEFEFETIFDQIEESSSSSSRKIMEPDAEEEEISECYRRDPRDDPNRPIPDKDGLRQLLSQRFETRKKGEYDNVREIDSLLRRNHGVRAYDNPCFWTRESTPPVSYLRRRGRRKAMNRIARFGPTGHPYVQVGEIDPMICPLVVPHIHSLLSRRFQYLLENRHVEADAMSFELLINGISTCDKAKLWRADGRNDFDESEEGVPTKPKSAPRYVEDVSSNRQEDEDAREAISCLRRVQQLVQMRSEAIVRGETDVAELLSFELYKTYEVGVNDQSFTFSFGSNFEGDSSSWEPPTLPSIIVSLGGSKEVFPPRLYEDEDKLYASPPYRRSEHSRNLPNDLILRRIESLVQERIHLREERKYIEADAIRRELWETYYVGISDRLRQWSVAGVLQEEDEGGGLKLGYVESGESKGLSATKRDEVVSLLGYLESTRLSGNLSAADRILKRLRDMYNVAVDVERMEWSVQPEAISQESDLVYQPQGLLGGIPPKQRASIQALIDRRYIELRNGNQQVADTISEALWRKHQVVINDDKLTWQVA